MIKENPEFPAEKEGGIRKTAAPRKDGSGIRTANPGKSQGERLLPQAERKAVLIATVK